MAAPVSMEDLVEKLLTVGQPGQSLTGSINESEITYLLTAVRDVFNAQSTFVEVDAPVKICGDVHGQYADLLRLFHRGGFPPQTNYLFLGDYVDRGKQNLETICLLFAYKVLYKENFFLLRGNHETSPVNRTYGFYDECQRRYSVRMWFIFQDVFNCMPFAGLVANRIICMHGGLSPAIRSFDQIRQIRRPVDPPNASMMNDLLWADPDKNVRGWQGNSRGVSYVFGADVVADFCQRFEVDLIARAHQVVADGYEFFAGRRLVTIFSAPHYCGEFDNAAGMMTVDENLTCSFEVLRPTAKPAVTKTA